MRALKVYPPEGVIKHNIINAVNYTALLSINRQNEWVDAVAFERATNQTPAKLTRYCFNRNSSTDSR